MAKVNPQLLKNARKLRSNQTEVEKILWSKLRSKQLYNYKFRRQYPIGSYIVDFICFPKKLIIELDGGQHAEVLSLQNDSKRDCFLKSKGFNVLRIWNNDILENLDGVLEKVSEEINKIPLSPPSPIGGGLGWGSKNMKKWKILNTSELSDPQEIVKVILSNRNITTQKEIDEFLHPKLESVTIDSVGIEEKEVKKTIQRIKKAIEKNEKIIVYGDYDVDGICGSAILWETLYSFYKNATPYIPHRVDEGYGLSIKGVENILEKNPDVKLIITVDNGIVAYDAIEFAVKKGIDVIITDHHVKEKELEDAFAIVHTTKLCGTSVAYLLSQEIILFFKNKKLSEKIPKPFGSAQGTAVRDDKSHLELVALATVADLVPLTHANRTLLKYGLEYLKKTTRIGLLELFKESGITKEKVGTYEIGHVIGPRINAMGRISHGMDSLRLICTKNPSKAISYASLLGSTNKDRQFLTEDTTLLVKSIQKDAIFSKIIFTSHEEYNQGIIGLVASRLVEEYYKPAFVLSIGEEFAKGSARSIHGVNIIEMIRSVSHTLIQAGGHPMAAGFTVEKGKIEDFKKALIEAAEKIVTAENLQRVISIDMRLDLDSVTQELYDALWKLSPFGMANPEPTFVSKVTIEDMRVIGKEGKHLKLKLSGQSPKTKDQRQILDAIGFGFGPKASDLKIGSEVEVVYVISENVWNGRVSLQLLVKDMKA